MKLVSVQFSHQRCVMQKEPEKGFDGSGHWNKIIRSQTHARIFHGPGRLVWLMQDHNIQNISRADWQHFSCKYFREWDSSTTLPAENRNMHLCHPRPSTDNNRHQVQSPSTDIHWKWYRKLKISELHAWRSNTSHGSRKWQSVFTCLPMSVGQSSGPDHQDLTTRLWSLLYSINSA